jgi:rhamnulokinase
VRHISQEQAIVAVDLGAESCRVSLLRLNQGVPQFEVVHRCDNGPIQSEAGLVWDFDRIVEETFEGLRRCADLAPEGIASIGVDGWAVDYARLGSRDALAKPFCYRDERTVESMAAVHALIPEDRLYNLTGAQTLRINTLYQLYADRLRGVEANWINLPEYLMCLLGGRRVSEYTNATHTQLVDVHTRDWCREVFSATGLSATDAPPIVQPGTDIGRIAGVIGQLSSFAKTRLIAPACHDTASAIAGIPARGHDWAFISSGTWSLVGTVVPECITGQAARAENFTNQGGVGGSIYFLKNVNGMWMLRQCMEHWKSLGGEWRLSELIAAAAALANPTSLLDVDDPSLILPGDMPARINAQLHARGEEGLNNDPAAAPEYANLIFHSLAARYARVLDRLTIVTNKRFSRVYIVGGGSRNRYLNRLIEENTGLEIIPGSAESSTIGNFAIQLAALEADRPASGVSAERVAYWAGVLDNTPDTTPTAVPKGSERCEVLK